MIQYKKILMTLALLLTAVTGAWATEPRVINSEISHESLKVGDILVEGFSISGPYSTMFYFNAGRAKKGETLLTEDVKFYKGDISSVGTNAVITVIDGAYFDAAGTYTPIDENGQVANAWIVTAMNGSGNSDFHLSGYKYVAPTTEPAIEVTPGEAANTWTFVMPAFDVEIAPIYAPTAVFATDGNQVLIPTAIEGIYAESNDAIVKAGTVAKIGGTDNVQGTLMYAVSTSATEQPALTAFNATLPTAKDITAAGDVYVWYYIKGVDAPDGETATAENTFNDSEICETPLTVTVRSNKFDIQFKAANDNTIEASKATVTVGGTAATVTEGKLEGVKMGSEVKLEAKPGYKFRKVEVKKVEKKPELLIVNPVVGQVIGSDGKNYAYGSLPTGVTAVAKICYVSGSNGLALALTDEGNMNWSTAQTTCAAHTAPFTGGTWKLASQGEWNNMISAAGSYTALRVGFSSVGGTNMQNDFYWSSTEDGSNAAFRYRFDFGSWASGYKTDKKFVRACLAF